MTTTAKWAKTCRQQPSGSLYMLALFVSSQLWWTHLISQLSPALQRVILRQERRRSLSNIKSVTLVTTGIQREASIRRQELNTKTTTEFGEDSAHEALCQSTFIFIALILRCFCSTNQLFFFFFGSCTLLSEVAQAPTICNLFGVSECTCQQWAETKRKS